LEFSLKYIALVISFAWAIGFARPANAHPHAWIDLWIEVVFDSTGAITGLRETWLFDDFYSVYATEGMDLDKDGQPDKEPMAKLVRENIESLSEYDYFTKAWIGGNPIKLAKVTEMSSDIREKRLTLIYYVPFEKSVRTDIGALTYSIYDPSYYTEMLHAEVQGAIKLIGAPKGCDYELSPAEPKEKEVSLAFSLSATETVSRDLGQFFAEKVSVRCTSHE
jgi:ABC-type uncharacterized transport system substrate-binding protein